MYSRPVRKRRTAFLDDPAWLEVFERGKLPRPDWVPIDDRDYPPPFVGDLVMAVGLDDLRRRLELLCMAFSKPSTRSGANGASSSTVRPGQLLTPFSELWAFLTSAVYADGTPRSLGGISVKLGSGGLQVTLTDPTSASYCCHTAESLDDAFLALEVGLKEGTLAWRSSGYAKPKK